MDCVGTILGFLTEPVINCVKHHGAYVIRYKNKVEQLEQENKKLGEKKKRIQERVDRATINGEAFVTEDVLNWLKGAEDMEGAIANFLRAQENGESCVCIPGCMCPDLICRYKTGKEADDKKEKVINQKNRGDELEKSPLTCDAPFDFKLKFDSSKYYTTFQSRALVVEDIKNALNDSGVDMIGVHGPGGAGKTTMEKEAAKDAEKLGIFHKIAIAVVSKDPNTSKLQEDIATQLNLEYKGKSELERADGLRKALLNGKKKILVILDDLWQFLDLTKIGIPTSGLAVRGCKILLTSRNKEVFNMMEVGSRLSIGYLEKQETWKLFRKVTGESGVDESIARKVSERCGGLPIAIVAVGAALRGKEEFEWKDALHRLEKCPLKHIEGIQSNDYIPLKWSYDFLKEKDAKSCFLLCCLFPEDADISIDDLVKYSFALGFLSMVDTLKDARNRVQAMVNMLRWSCLLLNGKNENFVKMHDVIRDLAISITKEKQTEHDSGHDWPGQQQFIVDHNIRRLPRNDAWKHHRAISLRSNVDDFTFSVLDCPLVHTLVLNFGNSYLEIPNDFFKGMTGARVVDLIGLSLDPPSSSFWELDNLRMLRLKYCDLLGDLSRIQNLKNHLKILSIAYDELYALPREIGELTSLQSLDLRHCPNLSVIPKGVMSNLVDLEELYVESRFTWWDTTIDNGGMSNASIVELESLTQLSVLHVGMSTKSSRIMVRECHGLFEKLKSFAIYININDFNSWDGSRNVLEISDIHPIDEKFHLLMDKVDELRLSGIQDLRYGKSQLQFTSSGGGSFCKLTDLIIVGCCRMKYLFSPSCAKAFQQLKKLRVLNCGRMEQIIGIGDHYNEEEIDEVIVFSHLREINLNGLSQFRCFCPEMKKTINEESLSNSAESIFNKKVSFSVLEILTINELSSSSQSSVKSIWKRETIQSSCAKEVSFSQLKEVTINKCHNLVNVFPPSMTSCLKEVFFSQLKEVTINKCHNLVNVFPPNMTSCAKEVSFSQLEKVTINKCHNLINVFPPSMISRLQNLEILSVSNCHSLTLLVEDFNSNIRSTDNFKSIVVFPNLRDLKLYDLPKLMRIWPNDMDYCSYDNFVQLYPKFISIQGCGSLRHVFSTFVVRRLAGIEQLFVRTCPKMEVIVSEVRGEVTDDDIIKFSQLKSLELSDLPHLKSFYQFKSEASHLFNHQVFFPFLEELVIQELPVENLNLNMQSPAIKSKYNDVFPKLRDLKLNYLPKLMKTWFNDEDYCSCDDYVNLYLKSISITSCSSLRHTFSAFVSRQLACVERLRVEACPGMEVIVSETRERVIDDGIIEFCQLKKLHLVDLSNLKSFYQSKSEVSYLFNDQLKRDTTLESSSYYTKTFTRIEHNWMPSLN